MFSNTSWDHSSEAAQDCSRQELGLYTQYEQSHAAICQQQSQLDWKMLCRLTVNGNNHGIKNNNDHNNESVTVGKMRKMLNDQLQDKTRSNHK